MGRHFSHLNSAKKKEIYAGFLGNEPKLRIAQRLQIDVSSVRYQINKIKALPRAEIIALIVPLCANGHPSFKCGVCGIRSDNIRSNEYQEIVRLRQRVYDLERELRSRQPVSHTAPRGPITASPVVGITR